MPTLSIITAVKTGLHHYIRETYESIKSQKLPSGWDLQWVIQEDGETGIPRAELGVDEDWISWGQDWEGRAPMARSMALVRARGELMRTIDADDLLPDPYALHRDITTLVEHPEIVWTVSGALDLFPDGTLRPGPRDPAPGPLPAGFLADGERQGLLPVVGTTMCTYTELVRALGGWQALVTTEDVALMLAVEAVSPGWMLDQPGLLYRRWKGDVTDKTQPAARSPQRDLLLERADMLRALGWSWRPPMPLGAQGAK